MTRVELPALGGFEAESVLTTLGHHAVPGSEVVTAPTPTDRAHGVARIRPTERTDQAAPVVRGTYRRLVDLAGTPTPVTLEISGEGIALEAPEAVVAEAAGLVCWWFGLSTDPAPVVAHLGADPRLAPWIRRRPALRPVRHPAGFEAAIDTVLGQQVTLSSARLFGERLRAAYSPGEVAGLRVFPSAAALVAAPLEELRAAVGLTTARARTVQAVARLFADGFRLGPGTDPSRSRDRLRQVPGVGPWTVEYLALRALGDPDAFPASDAVVRRALAGAPPREAQRAAEPWRPYRAWATAHLWAGQVTA